MWVPKTVMENEAYMSPWTKEKRVGVWHIKGKEKQLTGIWKSKCLINKMLDGPHRNNGPQRGMLADLATPLPAATPGLRYNIAAHSAGPPPSSWDTSSIGILFVKLGKGRSKFLSSPFGPWWLFAQNNLLVTMSQWHILGCPPLAPTVPWVWAWASDALHQGTLYTPRSFQDKIWPSRPMF